MQSMNVSASKEARHAEEEGGPQAIKNRINAIDVSKRSF